MWVKRATSSTLNPAEGGADKADQRQSGTWAAGSPRACWTSPACLTAPGAGVRGGCWTEVRDRLRQTDGRTLADLNLLQQNDFQLLAIRARGEVLHNVLTGKMELQLGDILILAGNKHAIVITGSTPHDQLAQRSTPLPLHRDNESRWSSAVG